MRPRNKQQKTVSISDKALVRRAVQKDPEAMGGLITRYQDRIYNVILKICINRDDAAELTQDTFVKVIDNIGSFKGKSSFYTWLFRIAVNLTLNFRKKRLKTAALSLDTPAGAKFDDARASLASYMADENAPDPVELAEKAETAEIIMASLERLDDNQRTILVLRDIEAMSYAQIAEILEIELGTVKSRLSRARIKMKEILETVLK